MTTQTEQTAHDSAMSIIAAAKARRTAAGLVLTWNEKDPVTGEIIPFTCYPKDEEQKQRWAAKARADGKMA